MEISLQVTILLFASVFGYVLARRFGQSAVIGELLIGILIGPTLLGWVEYNEVVQVLGELGAIFLLFTIGLECNYKHIYTWRNSFVALIGIIIPFFGGWGLARLFGYQSIEALFIGVALTATSIAITAHVLREKGVMSESFSKTIMGAAVVDDILSLLALSVVGGLSADASWAHIGIQAGIAVSFVGATLLLIKPVNYVIRYIHEEAVKIEAHKITLFATMIVAFGYAGIAELIGLSSVIGAFLAGVSMEELNLPDLRKEATYFEMLFSAIFFVALGVLTDLSQMSGAWIFAIILTLVAIATKFVGGIIPSLMTKHTMRESVAIGIGLIPRGEVAMIVGLIGLSAGVISQSTYGTIIFMAFVTTVIAPPLLSKCLPAKSF